MHHTSCHAPYPTARQSVCVRAQSDFTDQPNSQIRKITAQRLLESKTTVPHYYLTIDLNADKLLALRGALNEKLAPSGGKLSVNDFIIKASAMVRRTLHAALASCEQCARGFL